MHLNIRHSNKKRIHKMGFRSRMKTRGGRKLINRRRKRGRTLSLKIGP